MTLSYRIQTPRLLLRALTRDDRDAYFAAHKASADFWRPWMPAPPVGADDSAEGAFERWLERVEKDGERSVRLTAFDADGRLVAFISLNDIVRGAFHNANMGWRVSTPFARLGYATEGVTAMLDFAFAAEPAGLSLHRVQANIIPRNIPSIKLADKIGFRREGLALRYLKIAGQWEDHIMFAKLADEHHVAYIR